MPRPKNVLVYTVSPGPSPAGKAEVWSSIKRLVLLANQHDAASWTAARKADQALTAISERGVARLRGWPPSAVVVFRNLLAIVQSGKRYLRRCSECRDWFISKHKTRQFCSRDCDLARGRRRAAKAREAERKDKRRYTAENARKGTVFPY